MPLEILNGSDVTVSTTRHGVRLYTLLVVGIALFDLLLLIVAIPTIMIPAWHIPSLNIKPIRSKVPIMGQIGYFGSMYTTVLLAYERNIAVHQGRNLTLKRAILSIVVNLSFAIIYNLPIAWVYELGGAGSTAATAYACTTPGACAFT